MLLAISYTALVHKIYLIRADWDPEAAVWVVTSDDIPGLVTEAVTLEALIGKLQGMVPELLQPMVKQQARRLPMSCWPGASTWLSRMRCIDHGRQLHAGDHPAVA